MACWNGMECCGMAEIHGIEENNARKSMWDLVSSCAQEPAGHYDWVPGSGYRWVNPPPNAKIDFIHECAHAVFTQAGARSRYGFRFAAFIATNHLGRVIRTPTAERNPNTRRMIHCWIWTPDWDALQKWYEKEKK